MTRFDTRLKKLEEKNKGKFVVLIGEGFQDGKQLYKYNGEIITGEDADMLELKGYKVTRFPGDWRGV